MKFKTSITNLNNGEEIIRGHKLEELMQKKSFAEAIYLILKGELPDEKETKMFNAILTSAIDHGPGTASALTARVVASAKNSVNTAVAAGILAMGESHGGATGDAGKFFQENINTLDIASLVKDLKEKKIRIPGYGHATLTHDHRSDTLFAIAKETGMYGKHSAFAEAVFEQLKLVSSKPLPLNVDGSMAAILSDMGFPWDVMKGIFIIARVPGLVVHVYEEMKGDAGLRRLPEEDIEYI
ncbi:MAG: citryl-CoA lyase [Patescibacteria group bacterium]